MTGVTGTANPSERDLHSESFSTHSKEESQHVSVDVSGTSPFSSCYQAAPEAASE